MAEAYKCDICGTFYEGDGGRTMRVTINMAPVTCTDHVDRYDICPDCMDSFRLWMKVRRHEYKSAFEDKEDGVISKSGRVFIK